MLEKHLQRLLTTEGFIEAFWENCADHATQEQAFDAVNRQFKNVFGKDKYKNFESFRQCRDRFIKEKILTNSPKT